MGLVTDIVVYEEYPPSSTPPTRAGWRCCTGATGSFRPGSSASPIQGSAGGRGRDRQGKAANQRRFGCDRYVESAGQHAPQFDATGFAALADCWLAALPGSAWVWMAAAVLALAISRADRCADAFCGQPYPQIMAVIDPLIAKKRAALVAGSGLSSLRDSPDARRCGHQPGQGAGHPAQSTRLLCPPPEAPVARAVW